MTICRTLVILLLSLFACHTVFFHHIHSHSALERYAESQIILPRPDVSSTQSIDSSILVRVRDNRAAWLVLKSDAESKSILGRQAARDSGMITALWLIACVTSLLSCLFLLDPMLPSTSARWSASLRISYLLAPSVVTLSNLIARELQAWPYLSRPGPSDVIYGAIASSHRLLYIGFPAAGFAEWVCGAGGAAMILDPLQVVTLIAALVLLTYRMTTGKDDW